MKKSHLIALITVAIAIAVIITMANDASTYVTFKEARNLLADNYSQKVHVVGELVKKDDGSIADFVYDPEKDPNYFTFLLKDTLGNKEKVVYYGAKPQDFEKSEKIVVIGSMEKDFFRADKILMKCPSKYTAKKEDI